MLTDSHTYNYGYLGSRATGGKAGKYMIVVQAGRARSLQAN